MFRYSDLGLALAVMGWLFSGGQVALALEQPALVRDFPLRTHGTLQIRNQRGSVHVTSWTLDKIRVEAVRRTSAESKATSGPPLLPEIRFKDLGAGEMELFADYGRGLGIYDKVKELRRGELWKDGVDLHVKAPARLALRLLVKDGAITVKSWAAAIESRSESGAQRFSDIRAGELRVFCPACELEVEDLKADARLLCGEKPLSLKNVTSQKLYAETTSGRIKLQNVESAEQTYVTQDGSISGLGMVGAIQFETQKGSVELEAVSGHVQGRTRFGNIRLSIDQWRGDKGTFESEVGQIRVGVPAGLWNQIVPKLVATSAKGEVTITRQTKQR